MTFETRELDNPMYSQIEPADLASPLFRQQSNMASLMVMSCASANVFSNW